MEILSVKNLTFRYPNCNDYALNDISFSINSGDFITLCGPSGCGKSTLLRHLKPDLAPFGEKRGDVLFENKKISNISRRQQSEKIGFVLQCPDNQIVTDKVWHELAFTLESLGYDNNTIRKRVAETAGFFGLESIINNSISNLSGGQKQLINLASIMAVQPSLLILDEPTGQLDPIASAEFISCLYKINREFGTTIIITEHKLDDIIPISNKVIVLDNGKQIVYDTPIKVGKALQKTNSKLNLYLPAPMRIWQAVEKNKSDNCPTTVAEGRLWLENYKKNNQLFNLYEEAIPEHKNEKLIEIKDIRFRYNKNSPDILNGLSLSIYKGEFIAILGGNGTGKSTALSIINQTNKPYSGKVKIYSDASSSNSKNTYIATLPQNPQTLFIKKTVIEDLYELFDNSNTDKNEINRRIASAISICRLNNLCDRHPYDLSGGEQQRLALAKILLLKPKILLLDEPTKGLDAEFKVEFAQILKSLTKSGVTIVMVSHDMEFCAKYAHHCALIFDGKIVTEGSPREFFSSNSFYVTTSNRMSRNIIDKAITVEDVIFCCTGVKPEEITQVHNDDLINSSAKLINFKQKNKKSDMSTVKKIISITSVVLLIIGIFINLDVINGFSSNDFSPLFNYSIIGIPIIILMFTLGSFTKKYHNKNYNNKSKISKRTVIMAVSVLLLIPITIFIGITYLQDEKYLFISLLVLIECMLPFFMVFEGKKPKATEITIISVLCAIAITSRIIFNMLPQFKPLIAFVIISAIAFGGDTGFLVGAVSMIISNMIYGQGAWTPWQMFAAGIIGFIAGILFNKGILQKNRLSLCIYGFMSTLIIYGGLLNLYAFVSSRSVVDINIIMSFFIQGLPFDIIHSLSTVVFIFFAGEPMLEKLDRIKVKYGIMTQ